MNHSFNAKIIESDKPRFDTEPRCSICGRREIDHTDNAICDMCGKCCKCNPVSIMLLCEVCARPKVTEPEPDPKRDKLTALLNRLEKEIPEDRRAYFVGRITSIVDIESELIESGIDNPNYKLAEIVEGNLVKMRERITGLHQQIRELQGTAVADQRYLNQLVPQLRAEEREKFKEYDINYKPSVVIPTATANKPRMSASDKAMESYAKMLGISIEQAKIVMQSAMKNVTGAICTCAETPGLCKVHP